MEINTKALGRGAPEMFLYPSEFPYWQPADSIAIFKLLALKMSSHIDAEVTCQSFIGNGEQLAFRIITGCTR